MLTSVKANLIRLGDCGVLQHDKPRSISFVEDTIILGYDVLVSKSQVDL
jgi:hypothetical protein